MPGPYTYGQMAQGLWQAVGAPMLGDVRRGNRALQEAAPLPYNLAQMHPAIGIPTSALNYADAAEAGDREGMVKASLSGIPIMERGYAVGNTLTQGLKQLLPQPGTWRKTVELGRRAAAGENVAEAGEAGYQQGQPYAR